MPYEILKGARPPRWMVRMHYVKTREMVEARIPAIANLPKIEPQVPGVPSGMPTVPSVIWSHIIYPYDVFQKVRGMVSGEPSPSQSMPAAPRGPGQVVEGIIVGRLLERRGWEPTTPPAEFTSRKVKTV